MFDIADLTFISADIEADGLLDEITKTWCGSFRTHEGIAGPITHQYTTVDPTQLIKEFARPKNVLIMHYGVSYDAEAMKKVYGMMVEAEIIDTLYLSWYLEPKRLKHGLESYGEEFGVPKPPIVDWETLEIEDYIHRVEEDTKIQQLLWRRQWKHLMLLYGTEEAALRAARHITFKARQAQLQEASRWKLDVEKCEEMSDEFGTIMLKATEELQAAMPKVPKVVNRPKPKKPFKVDGTHSAAGARWFKLIADQGLPLDHTADLKEQTGWKPPNAASHQQMKAWLYSLGWKPETFVFKRDKETNEVKKIEQIKDKESGELCNSIKRLVKDHPELQFLDNLSVVTHRKGVVDGFLRNVDDEGFVVAAVQGLTNTLRFKHKVCLNLPSERKPYGKEIRSLLMRRSPFTEICGADLASVEDRTKQHYMMPFDPEYVADMQRDDFDPHCDMAIAATLMTEEEAKEYKEIEHGPRHSELALIRYAGKTTNYAATYGAQAQTLARAAGVSEKMGNLLFEGYWKRNWSIKAIAESCIVKTSRDMKWLWNPVAQLWVWLKAEKDKFSTLNQSTATYCFDRWLFHIIRRREQLTAQFHDEGVWELQLGFRAEFTQLLEDALQDVNDELNLNRELGCDISFGVDYSEVH